MLQSASPPSSSSSSTEQQQPILKQAFVTLLTSDSYALGALVLAHSLRATGTRRKLVCLVTSPQVSSSIIDNHLRGVFDEVVPVEAIRSSSVDNLQSLGRPDLLYAFTKLHLWSLTKYERVVFLDADTLVLQNVDELFDVQQPFAACPDIGWPDCFNSGVFVTRPSADTLNQLMLRARSHGSSFDGGDQGLLNDFFPYWHRLSFVYNVTPSATYTYLPAYRRYRQQIKIVHFIGQPKPWDYQRYTDGSPVTNGSGSTHQEFLQLWWQVFAKHVRQWPSLGGTAMTISGSDASAAAAARLSHDYAQAPQNNTSPPPANPFFKSRYDWDEAELGMKKGNAATAAGASGSGTKSKFTQPPSDDVLTARLPLKKQQKTTAAAPPYQHPPKHK